MKKAALIATVLVGAIVLGATKTWNDYIAQIEERFPDMDPQIIRKTYRKMMLKSITGKLAVSDLTDEDMDKIFLALAEEQTHSK